MKVLISRPDKIGDVTLALHGIKQLKLLRPDFKIYIHVAPALKPLVDNISFLDGVIVMGDSLAEHKFDAVVDLMAKPALARLYFLARIPVRIGNSARWFRFFYTRCGYIRRSKALMNEAEYNWQLISLVDETLKDLPLTESLSPEDFKNIVEREAYNDSYVLMPGISASARAWSNESWIELAKLIAQDPQKKVVIILGPQELEFKEQYGDYVASVDNLTIADSLSFEEILGILLKAKAYVGPSTGVTHLASAVKTPGIALYPLLRSMHPRRWQPFKSSLRVLSLADNHTARSVNAALKEISEGSQSAPGATHENTVHLSAFIICMNQERTIRRCLESISWVDEIVVVDSGSTDRTLDICEEYGARIIKRDWPGHREQKQFALDQCRGKWVLNIDSDEELSPQLKERIRSIMSRSAKERDKINGYLISRVVYFKDRWWDQGGWYPEYRMRLFKREVTKWGGINPHEKAIVPEPTKKIEEPIYHYSWKDFNDLAFKFNKLSTNSATAVFNSDICPKKVSVIKIIMHSFIRFFKFYIVKRGYREGLVGFIVAVSEAYYTFMKYAKIWELLNDKQGRK